MPVFVARPTGAAEYLAEIGADGVPEGSHNSNKGSSQYRGVSWHERSQRWEVRVWGGGKQHFIGEWRCSSGSNKCMARAVLPRHRYYTW